MSGLPPRAAAGVRKVDAAPSGPAVGGAAASATGAAMARSGPPAGRSDPAAGDLPVGRVSASIRSKAANAWVELP